MAKIVGIHGIAEQISSSSQLRDKQWLPALGGGLENAANREGLEDTERKQREDLAKALKAGDLSLSVVYWGDLFRPEGAMGGGTPAYIASDLTSDEEIELLTALYNRAVEVEPELGPPAGGLGKIKVGVQIMVARLLESATFARVAEKFFIGDLKQVTEYLHDPRTREFVLQRVDKKITPDTTVLIGHSLGSVIAYEYLCQYQPPGITSLITLGSPLGIPNAIFDALTPPPVAGKGVWPGAVTRWVNVADPDDIVPLKKDLTGLFPPPAGIPPIQNKLVENGKEAHYIENYLSAATTGEALVDALNNKGPTPP